MKAVKFLTGLVLAGVSGAAFAGPPYLTDDPVPTDTKHWELYGFVSTEGHRSTLDGDAGLDLNYGALKDVQLTATLPMSFSRSTEKGWRSGFGDIELGVKYRFFNDEDRGLSAAIFPRVILPTENHEPHDKTRVLLPMWLGKDFAGGTSLFGGGGYEINPGSGNRNYWQAAIALTHDFSDQLSAGVEIARQGPDTLGATAQTRAGIGTILKLSGPSALLASGGPTWANHRTGYHLYAALGANF